MLQGSGLVNLKGGKRKFNFFSKHCLMKESCDCLFKAKRVICRHMSYIPKLPPGTLILQLVDCHFPYITRENRGKLL
jgi:hypothetical protein